MLMAGVTKSPGHQHLYQQSINSFFPDCCLWIREDTEQGYNLIIIPDMLNQRKDNMNSLYFTCIFIKENPLSNKHMKC